MQSSQVIMLVAVMVVFYFLLVRPQQQQAKRQREMIASLVPGAEIVTIGGIFATVVSVGDERIRVVLAGGAELEIAPRAVSEVLARTVEDDAEEDETASDDALEAPEALSPAVEDADR